MHKYGSCLNTCTSIDTKQLAYKFQNTVNKQLAVVCCARIKTDYTHEKQEKVITFCYNMLIIKKNSICSSNNYQSSRDLQWSKPFSVFYSNTQSMPDVI